MKLLIGKRLDFCASHKLIDPTVSDTENQRRYGKDATGKYGHGHNFFATSLFSGPIEPNTGMIMDLSDIRKRLETHVLPQFDHQHLNDAFKGRGVPTIENISRWLAEAITTEFNKTPAELAELHLLETRSSSVTIRPNSTTQKREIKIGPARYIFKGNIDLKTGEIINEKTLRQALSDAIASGVFQPDLPPQREALLKFAETYPIDSIETPIGPDIIQTTTPTHDTMTVQTHFYATHVLNQTHYTEDQNIAAFGKCCHPHGHEFRLSITAKVPQHGHKETIKTMTNALNTLCNPLSHQFLNEVIPLENNQVYTCENVILYFWNVLQKTVPGLSGMVLWETPHNVFKIEGE